MTGGVPQLSQWPQARSNVSPKQVSRDRVRQVTASVSATISSSFVRITRLRASGADGLCEPVPGLGDILATIKQQCVSRIAIPPGATDLLVIGFRAVRHIQMHDEPHIRPVDAHAERDGRHHHQRLSGTEPHQRLALVRRIETGVKRQRRKSLFIQFRRDAFGFCSAAAIDNPALSLLPLEEVEQLRRLADLRCG